MPVILERSDFAAWLHPSSEPADLLAMLKPVADGKLDAYEVGASVGSPKNQGQELVVPLV